MRAGLQCLELDFDAYGCVFAASLLHTAPLPALRRVALMNVEAQHVAALRALPALRHVLLGREINGPVTAGPAAELLVAQLAGLPLRSLSLSDYRLLPSLLISVADALPGLEELALGVEKVEQHGRLELAALPQLAALRSFELRLLGMRASAEGVTVGVLPGEAAAALRTLTSLLLAHVRPAAGEEEAFWAGLAALPALAQLRFEASVHAVRQPPAALLRLSTLTALHIQLPELPEGALPSLASLHVSSVGLLALPASWCRLPLEELSLSGRSSWNAFYNLRLPDELATLAPTLRTLRLDNCGLRGLPEQVCKLTGLTSLRLRHNNVLLLPSLSSLKHLQELDICGNLTFKAAEALQGCGSLRRLLVRDVGPLASAGRRRSLGADEVGPAMAEAVLEGCFVRLKRGSTHMLRRVLAARLPPPGAPHDQLKLAVEGVPAPISWRKLSDADPLHDGTQYDASGRAELRALQEELAAAGRPRGVPLAATAAAAWRRKVALSWAFRLEELMGSLGIGQLVTDMQDPVRLQQLWEFLDKVEPAGTVLPPGLGSPGLPPLPPLAGAVLPPPPPMSSSAMALSNLVITGLPPDTTNGALAAFLRARYPASFQLATVVGPDVGLAKFSSREARDAALVELRLGCNFRRCLVSAELPREDWPADWVSLRVSGLPLDVTSSGVAALFRQRFRSVTAVFLPAPSAGVQARRCYVAFSKQEERDAAMLQMEGEEYLGCVLAVRLPRNEHPNHPCPASPAAGAPQNPPAAPRALLLMISNLPADATAAQLAAFMRARFPASFQAADVIEPGCGKAFFSSKDTRDAALAEMNGVVFQGCDLSTLLPPDDWDRQLWQEEEQVEQLVEAELALAARTPDAAQQGAAAVQQGHPVPQEMFSMHVFNLGNTLTGQQLAAYLRSRYPSVASARLLSGHGVVRFSCDAERHRARVEMDGHILPGMFVPPGLFPGMAPPPFVSAAARAASFAAPGSAAARLPPWVLPTFAEACRRLVRHQGLPFDDIDVAEMMDRIRERRRCLDEAEATPYGLCLMAEECGMVLVKSVSVGVNPVDLIVRSGFYMPASFPKILGGDVAGVVEEADEGSKWKKGDKVFALTPASSTAPPRDWLAAVPDNLPVEQAAGVPLVALNAWQALQQAKPAAGQRALVNAAAGGVGHMAVQLANTLGLYVVGICGPKNVEWVKGLGADEVVDYTTQDVAAAYADAPFHIAVDCMGTRSEVLQKLLSVTKPSGHLSHILNAGSDEAVMKAAQEAHAAGKGPSVGTILVTPNGEQLQQISNLIGSDAVRLEVALSVALAEAAKAHDQVAGGHTRGKVVLTV
ncbi:NADPH:quinone reductase [Micractinium conductrix]|uniref:NADPH:quinone reductase n=1 Tax=Micractinium conductrix TaxID=554055 RepID=A0A2P6V8S9_9CHLO|nr:NADPH:quinone reductase [Micractinium conductrix]|eukprot:PSC70488.1 NADPH:quinone reductase [Micractinium conductrix]